MMYTIYKATSPSGKIYIGMTTQALHLRKSQHKYLSRKSKNIFHKAIQKYGFDAFEWEIVFETLDPKELGKMETKFIEELRASERDFGYNEKLGGQEGWKHSPETRRKMSEIKKMSPSNFGHPPPREVRVFKDGCFVGKWPSIIECSRALELNKGNVSACLLGLRKSCKGFTFERDQYLIIPR